MIIKRLVDLVVGTNTVEVSKENTKETADFLIKEKIGFDIVEDGESFVIRVRSYDAKKLARFADRIGAVRGLPRVFKRYGKRWGIYVGAAIFCLTVVISQRLVWRIDVAGCDGEMKETVLKNLESLGFTYGTDFKKTDFDKLHNDYLRKFDDMAWISVNMKGTWANVEVKEASIPDTEDHSGVMNVVAAESGIITAIEPEFGKAVVRVGDFVSEGELLISGIITSGEDGLRFAPSDGRVFAEVRRNFSIEIPKVAYEKKYTGEEFTEKKLIFFKNCVKLSGNYRISRNEYDTIYNKERLSLFGRFPLPFFKEEVVYKEYENEERELSYSDASEEFEVRYPRLLSATLDGAKLVSVSFRESESDSSYIREYEVVCEADIAEQKAIEVK